MKATHTAAGPDVIGAVQDAGRNLIGTITEADLWPQSWLPEAYIKNRKERGTTPQQIIDHIVDICERSKDGRLRHEAAILRRWDKKYTTKKAFDEQAARLDQMPTQALRELEDIAHMHQVKNLPKSILLSGSQSNRARVCIWVYTEMAMLLCATLCSRQWWK